MILLSISLLAIILAFIVYRKQPFQFILRVVAIALIYSLLSNYVLSINTGVSQQIPVVLIDHSKSMEKQLPRVIDVISRFEFPHQSFFFQESVLTDTRPENLGSYTNIAKAMRECSKSRPSVLMLITDGNHNSGESPLLAADDIQVPVYAYGVGAEGIRDIAIMDVTTPAYAYEGDSILIETTIESSGFPTGEGQVTLATASGKRVAAQKLFLSESPARRTVKFRYAAGVAGELRLNIEVSPAPGEISYENNTHSSTIKVLKGKIKVLYYTDHVSFNTRFLRKQLKDDDNLSLSSFANAGNGKYLDIDNVTEISELPDPRDYDVIILDNTNVNKLPWSEIPRYVNDGKGVILIGTLDRTDAAWQSIIPINTTGGVIVGSHSIQVKQPFSVLTEESYPPLSAICRTVGSKQDAVIIADASNLPLIGYRREGRGIVFQICIVDLAAWNFMQSGFKSKDLIGRFASDIVRFLSHFGAHDRLVLATQKRDYAVGETVDLTLQSYDRDLRRAGGGDFFLVANGVNIPFYETTYGYYATSIIFEEPGKQQVVAQGKMDEEKLTSNKVALNITSRIVETEYRLNRNLLEGIAARTNGKFFLLDELDTVTLPEDRNYKTSRVIRFNSPPTYFFVLIILVADWVLRRRRGVT